MFNIIDTPVRMLHQRAIYNNAVSLTLIPREKFVRLCMLRIPYGHITQRCFERVCDRIAFAANSVCQRIKWCECSVSFGCNIRLCKPLAANAKRLRTRSKHLYSAIAYTLLNWIPFRWRRFSLTNHKALPHSHSSHRHLCKFGFI